MSTEFNEQKKFYNDNYTSHKIGDLGFPDLKICDFDISMQGKKILNIGCGEASDVWFLSNNNEIDAIDGSEEGVQEASRHGIRAIVGDVSRPLPYYNGMFDIVILKDILEHLYNPFDLLIEAKRILKDDGYIIISLPNHFYLPFRLRILFGNNLIWKSLLHNQKNHFEEWNYMHIRFFTWRGFKKMIEKAGMRQDKCYWDFGTWAHYSDPLMFEYAFKLNNKKITNRRQWLIYKILFPGFKVFNFLVPKKFRAWIVSLAPGLLCAGFYVRINKNI